MVDKDLKTSPGARRSDRLFFVANTGNRAHVTHDVEDVREVLRWRGGRGGRVFVMRATADCSRLVTDAPEAVKQSVRLFMYALSHGKGGRGSRSCLSGSAAGCACTGAGRHTLSVFPPRSAVSALAYA